MNYWPGSQVVRQGSAKPLYRGSIPLSALFENLRPGGGTGRHEGLKILWLHKPCEFESRPGHFPPIDLRQLADGRDIPAHSSTGRAAPS